jgi:hypothetical protein
MVQSEKGKNALLNHLSYQGGFLSWNRGHEDLRGTERGIFDNMAQYLKRLSYSEKGKGKAEANGEE